MISYDKVKSSVRPAPRQELVELYNELDRHLSNHPNCINEVNPFSRLYKENHFCISATSIQSNYIAFVLGKHHNSIFPTDIMIQLFNVESNYTMQFAEIPGKHIDGAIFVYHRENEELDLQKIYDHIYEL